MLYFLKKLLQESGNTAVNVIKKMYDDVSDFMKFKQKETSYYDSVSIDTSPLKIKKVLDNAGRLNSSRRELPPSYDEYIQYPHRKGKMLNTRIGDVCLLIPPQFINIIETSANSSQSALRVGSYGLKNAYKRREVSITAFFNGEEQINGYEVDGPIGKFYVDGIRALFAQYMVSPFVPIVNELVNETYGIYNVVLNNLTISTVQGYPNALEVNISMIEVTLTPYLEAPDVLFHDMIDWDLFRFNYQRFLIGDKTIRTPFKKAKIDSNDFKLYQIKTNTLHGTDVENDEILNDKNFELILSSDEELEVQTISFSFQNIVPIMQMNNYTTPVPQYIGKGSNSFVISLLTYNTDVVTKISNMSSYSAFLAKEYKEYGTFGFNKIENELLNMFGVNYILIDKIEIATVQGYPNLNQVTILCTAFDSTQKDREDLVGFTPFKDNEKGTKADAISQDHKGMLNKIRQDNIVEEKLNKIELYPELQLPTFEEADEYIAKVIEFRKNNNLPEIKYSKYPRPFSIVPGKGAQGVYNNFLDPDFYVFYPVTYSDMDDNLFQGYYKGPSEIVNATTIGRSVAYGDSLPEGFYFDEDGNVIMMNDIENQPSANTDIGSLGVGETNNALANLMLSKQGCGYVWAAHGQMYTPAIRAQFERDYGARHYINSEKWYGKQVFDCSGIICWCLRELGVAKEGYRTMNDVLFNDFCRRISKDELQPGDILNNPGTHIAVYIGNGKTIEAMNGDDGVKIGNLRGEFTQFGRIDSIPKINTKPTTSTNTSNNTNSQSNISSNSSSQQTPNVQSKDDNADYVIKQLDRFLKDKLSGTGKYYYASGMKYGINPFFSAAISCQETGYGKHVSYNNPGGIMDWDNNWSTLRKFSTIQEGIDFQHKNLKTTYLDKGYNTIESIGAKYCPINAPNDPYGYNKYWIPNVTKIYQSMSGETQVRVTVGANPGSTTNGALFNGGIDGANSGISTFKFKKSKNHGIVFGKRKCEFAYEKFGKAIFKVSPIQDLINESYVDEQGALLLRKEMYEEYLNGFSKVKEEDVLNSMYYDYMVYNHRGKLLRAFPTFMMLISDDGGEWLDGRRLWSNYYLYKSVISLSVHQERTQPVHTAHISVTNIHHNLDKKPKASEIEACIAKDPEYNELVRLLYRATGCLLGTPKLTDMMVDIKNKLYDAINIKTGLNIHVRLGYGSNPTMLNTVFSGVVTDIQIGEVLEMTAQSYGLELVNNIISGDPKKTNSIFSLGSEPSNIITTVMTKRDNFLVNSLGSGKWGESSAYGIEHFGLTRGHEFMQKAKEYDILKNIYYGRYEMQLYCAKGDNILWLDNEENCNFYLNNKTPWDLFQSITQTIPEFVCQPSYHQFEARLFFGLPYWLEKFRYDLIDPDLIMLYPATEPNGAHHIYETAKSFAQFHYIDGISDIIDNNIQVSSSEVKTNCVPMYSLGGDIKSAPTIYSDRSIYASSQSTSVIDTTLDQDYLFLDVFYEKVFFITVAKSAAIRMAISNLLDGWNRAYDGEIIIIGDSSIKPCDYVMINDVYSNMSGLCGVREVVHKFDFSGFCTSIVPDMIGLSTMKESGSGNIIKSLMSTGVSISTLKSLRTSMINITGSISRAICLSRKISGMRYSDPEYFNSLGSPTEQLNYILMNYINSGKLLTNTQEFTTLVDNTIQVIGENAKKNIEDSKYLYMQLDYANTIISLSNTIRSIFSNHAIAIWQYNFWGLNVPFINGFLYSVIDEFSYNNCVKIFPLMYKNEAFVAGCKGQTQLIIGMSENDRLKLEDEELEKDNKLNKEAEFNFNFNLDEENENNMRFHM